jgi:phospholipid transport system transporter-binding protein
MLILPQEISHSNARSCARMLVQALQSGPTAVVADAGALSRFDSSALAVLLECRREAQVAGKTFSVRAMPARLRSLAALYGVAQLLPAAP